MSAAEMEFRVCDLRLQPYGPVGTTKPRQGQRAGKCMLPNEFSNSAPEAVAPENSPRWQAVATDRRKSQTPAGQRSPASRRSGSNPISISQTTEWHRPIT
jgi:hypothetical protein